MSLSRFHPVVERWFSNRFAEPTEPQRRAWPVIQEGGDVLIAAPTGSGKTFAAFLSAIDGLVRQGLNGELRDEMQVVYVSPLKALSNDVQKNLSEPLVEIRAALAEQGLSDVEVRTLVRTGDTPQSERQAMLSRPPHILVTTPESLYLILTSDRAREMLRSVRTVIVDEIHAVARDKRGSHLALSLARLDALVGKRPQRIGLGHAAADRGDRAIPGRHWTAVAHDRRCRPHPHARPRARNPLLAARSRDVGGSLGGGQHPDCRADHAAQDDLGVREHPPVMRAARHASVRAPRRRSRYQPSRQLVARE